jgi:hypothetical protein
MWDYIYYMAYLGSKKRFEGKIKNTTEKYVHDMIEKGEHEWLPCYY